MATKKKTSATKRKKSNTSAISVDKITSVAMIILHIVAFIGLLAISYALYYFRNSPPTTVATGYVDSLAYAPDETYAIELQYFTNESNNGLRAYEVKFNYYTDIAIPNTDTEKEQIKVDANYNADAILSSVFKTIYSSGVQLLGDDISFGVSTSTTFSEVQAQIQLNNPYYFNSTNGVSYGAINKLDYKDNWIVDFGKGKLGKITQDKPVEKTGQFLWVSTTIRLDVNKFIRDVFDSINALSFGKQVLMFDLSDYFTFQYFSTEDLKFHSPSSDDVDLYVNILVNKDKNGMIDASQSLFGIVRDDAEWSYTGIQSSDYWKTHTEISLSDADFDLNENNELKLKNDAIEYFTNFDSETLNITIYINLANTNAVGFAKNAFGDLQIDSIVVTASFDAEFSYYELPENCVITSNDSVNLEVIV